MMLVRGVWRRDVAVKSIVKVRELCKGNDRGGVTLMWQGRSKTMLGAKFMYRPVILQIDSSSDYIHIRFIIYMQGIFMSYFVPLVIINIIYCNACHERGGMMRYFMMHICHKT